MKEGPKQVNESNEASLSALHFEKVYFRPGNMVNSFKPNDRDAFIKPITSNPQASIKVKKGIARNRASHFIRAYASEEEIKASPPLLLNALGRNPHEEEIGSVGKLTGSPSQVQFSIGSKSNLGLQFRGGFSRDQGAFFNGEECDGGRSKKSLEGFYGEGGREEISDVEAVGADSTKSHSMRNGSDGVSNHAASDASRGEADGKDGGLDRMELEGGGEGTFAF